MTNLSALMGATMAALYGLGEPPIGNSKSRPAKPQTPVKYDPSYFDKKGKRAKRRKSAKKKN